MRRLIADPDDTARVFEIVEALSGNTLARVTARFAATETGAEILSERRRLLPVLIDRDRLRAMAPESLGRAYADFCDRAGITADGLVRASEARREVPDDPAQRLVGERLRDMHDLWHVVTGYGTDLAGEAGLLAFSFAQTRNPGIAFIVAVGYARMRGEARAGRAMIVDGLCRGARAAWFPAQDWERLLGLPLARVRQILGVGPLPSYEPVLHQI